MAHRQVFLHSLENIQLIFTKFCAFKYKCSGYLSMLKFKYRSLLVVIGDHLLRQCLTKINGRIFRQNWTFCQLFELKFKIRAPKSTPNQI